MKKTLVAALTLLWSASLAFGQSPTLPNPAFVQTWDNNGNLYATNPQSIPYTIASSDCGKQVVLSGGLNTVTLPSVSGFRTNCLITIKNNDTRAKILSGFPSDQDRLLWPQQSVGIKNVNSAWLTFNKPGRWRLPAATTFFVNPSTGNDNNDGLASGTGAFLTLQKAWDTIVSGIDNNLTLVTIKAEDGTYTTGIRAGPLPPTGGGEVQLVGNNTTPTNVVIAPTVANSLGVQAVGPVSFKISGIYCNSANLGACLYTDFGGSLQVAGPMTFGTSVVHMLTSHGMIFVNSNYTISGSATYHLSAVYSGAQIEYSPITVTLTGTPNFTVFASVAGAGTIAISSGVTFVGSATGIRYAAGLNGVIDTGARGSTYLPGNAAGTGTSTGGQYN